MLPLVKEINISVFGFQNRFTLKKRRRRNILQSLFLKSYDDVSKEFRISTENLDFLQGLVTIFLRKMFFENKTKNSRDVIWRQSFKRNIVLWKSSLVLNFLTVRYFTWDLTSIDTILIYFEAIHRLCFYDKFSFFKTKFLS